MEILFYFVACAGIMALSIPLFSIANNVQVLVRHSEKRDNQ